MRVLFLTLAIVCTAAAQTATGPTIAVVDENGVAVQSAQVSLEVTGQAPSHCETNHTGRCSLPGLVAGHYTLRVQKEGFYALEQTAMPVSAGATVEVALTHAEEV